MSFVIRLTKIPSTRIKNPKVAITAEIYAPIKKREKVKKLTKEVK
jgi:hypothetical protein